MKGDASRPGIENQHWKKYTHDLQTRKLWENRRRNIWKSSGNRCKTVAGVNRLNKHLTQNCLIQWSCTHDAVVLPRLVILDTTALLRQSWKPGDDKDDDDDVAPYYADGGIRRCPPLGTAAHPTWCLRPWSALPTSCKWPFRSLAFEVWATKADLETRKVWENTRRNIWKSSWNRCKTVAGENHLKNRLTQNRLIQWSRMYLW